jgi:hypothetical protein
MASPLINGIGYAYSNLTVLIGGVPVNGITSISYNQNRETEDIIGKGGIPVKRGFGNIITEGSITLQMEELEALILTAPGGKLWNIPEFDIIVNWLPEGGVPITHVLKLCRFKNNGRTVAAGDMNIETEIEIAIGDVIFV